MKKGFTLIEILVSLAVFAIFMTVAAGAYISLMRAAHDMRVLRKTYQEISSALQEISDHVKSKRLSFDALPPNGATDILTLLDAQTGETTVFQGGEGMLTVKKGSREAHPLLSESSRVNRVSFLIAPSVDPYARENIYNDTAQFHPSVTIRIRFFDTHYLQTAVASRIYGK